MKYTITNLKNEEDLEIIAQEYAKYYSSSVLHENWTTETAIQYFKYFYNQAPDLFFVAYDQDRPIGVIMSFLKPWWDGMHLGDAELMVFENNRGEGIAKELIKKLFTYALEKYNVTSLDAHTYENQDGFPYCWYKRLDFETVDNWKIINADIKKTIEKLKK